MMCRFTLTQPEPAPGLHGALLGLQQHAEPGARDVLEAREVHDVRIGDAVEELQGLLALRGIEPSLEDHLARRTSADLEHPRYPRAMVKVMVLRRSANS